MSVAKLLINSQKEFEISQDLITIGRATDNDVSFFQDSNVSRNHAEIHRRGENEFWLADLNSSNGTTLNGRKVSEEKPLYDGDLIVFGGTSEIQFLIPDVKEFEKEEEELFEKNATESIEPADPEPQKSNISKLLMLSGLAVGLAIICVFAVAFFYFYKTDGPTSAEGDCQARATITNPQNGDILKQETKVEIALQDGECVSKVIFLIEDKAFATSESEPFTATLDPSQFPDLAADGLDHKLKLILEDENGKQILQPTEITLALETIRTKKPVDDENITETDPPINKPPANLPQDSQMSLIDVKNMTTKILPQFAGSFEYNASNQNFLQAVRQMQTEYASEGYFERAKKYSDVIAKEYIQNRALDPPLGFILAMSRTKFLPTNQATGAGLWKMDNNLVLESNYNGSCEAETIAAPTQKCAAIASSIYVKDIVRDVFEGDIIYGIAAFGMSKNEAAAWKATLPPPSQRKDFWNVIKSKEQKDEIVRFFAAATVAENPQKFGLQKDKPLSELYKGYIQ